MNHIKLKIDEIIRKYQYGIFTEEKRSKFKHLNTISIEINNESLAYSNISYTDKEQVSLKKISR